MYLIFRILARGEIKFYITRRVHWILESQCDQSCEFALRSGVVCVISHDRFHVEEDAGNFVVRF